MNNLLTLSAGILNDASFSTEIAVIGRTETLVFEGETTLGFLFSYEDFQTLSSMWEQDAGAAVSRYSFALKRAGQKAWNTYVILLAGGDTNYSSTVLLSAIEENLVGTRKIARAGLRDLADLRAALLTLLPLQSSPRLEAVDLLVEIRQRTTELPPRSVDAFLSNVDASVVLQILEEAS